MPGVIKIIPKCVYAYITQTGDVAPLIIIQCHA